MRRVHWLIHSPSPYMADLFRYLGPDYTVNYRFGAAADRPWKVSLTEGYRICVGRRALGIDWHFVNCLLTESSALFVMCSWNDPTELLAILIARAVGRRYVLWTDTPHRDRQRSRLKAALRGAILRFAFRGAHAVMGTGTPALERLREMGCPEEKLVNFPYFIDIEKYRVRKAHAGPLRFLSSGRLVAQKGFDIALRSLAAYEGEFQYRIAGSGEEEAHLRALASELGIAERVEFLGWLAPDAMRTLFAESDVLLHPAHFEPYGVCVLEAMASGLVVVGSPGTAAVVDRVIDGVNGLWHIEELNRIDCEVMGAAARRTAEEWPLSRAKEILDSIRGR